METNRDFRDHFVNPCADEARIMKDWLASLVEPVPVLFSLTKLVSILGIGGWTTGCFYILFNNVSVIHCIRVIGG